jgi:hypothetical protein
MTIDVKSNGSGNLGIALGMTDQGKALLASQGVDPMQTFTEKLGVPSGSSPKVKVTRWTDGDYEWVQEQVPYTDLNELNSKMSQSALFESFSITCQPGIFHNQFIVNARLKPLLQDTNTTDTSIYGNIDPSAFIEFQIAVHLPGSIIETNGISDSKNTSTMLWTVNSKQSKTMQATSKAWNWLNIGIAGSIGLIILVIGVIALLAIRAKPKTNKNFQGSHTTTNRLPGLPLSSNDNVVAENKSAQTYTQAEVIKPIQPVSSISTAFSAGMLTTIGARSLLQDVNHFLLKDTGSISETPDELHLDWPFPPGGKMRGIHIKLVSQQQIAINGQVFPATQEGVKTGIATCLHEMN